LDISYVRRCIVDPEGMRLLMACLVKDKKPSAILPIEENSVIYLDGKSRTYAPLNHLFAHLEVKGDPQYHV